MLQQPEPVPKVSIHLDLQAQIQSLAGSTQDVNVPIIPDEPVAAEKPQIDEEADRNQDIESEKLQELLQKLLDVRAERDRLQEESMRNELALSEERARREFAEAKLRSAKEDLVELEAVVRQRERTSRGHLLISQKSMEEICMSFSRLLKMLEESSRKSDENLSRMESEQESLAREDIKRRFALIIRKTKSENLKKANYVDDNTVLTRLQMTARYGRSEGNIRTTIEPLVPMIRMESNVGDAADAVGLPKLLSNFREQQFDDVRLANAREDSPGERARAIFARIFSGDARLSFSPQMR